MADSLRRVTEQVTDQLTSGAAGRLALLTVHAHPDDEASKGAPTVAKYSAEGVHTVLVCCTGGEEGDLQNPSLREEGQPFHGLDPAAERALVAQMREGELAASAAVIGFDEVEMLGYRDSGMPDTEPNLHPDSFHQADIDEATGRLVAIIRRTRPQVIITYGDDQSSYPHPDHLRVHDISVLAFERAGDPDWYPRARRAVHAVEALLLGLVASSASSRCTKRCSPAPASRRSSDEWLDRPSQDHRITTKVDVGDYLWARDRVVAGARHAGRPVSRVVVRPRQRDHGWHLPVGGLDPRPVGRRADPGCRRGARPVRRRARAAVTQ